MFLQVKAINSDQIYQIFIASIEYIILKMWQHERIKITKDNFLMLKYLMYHTRWNVTFSKTGQFGQKHLIELTHLANLDITLIDIFHYFFKSIYEHQTDGNKIQLSASKVIFNKFFIYLVDLYLLHDKYIEPDFKFNEQQDQRIVNEILQNATVQYQQKYGLNRSIKILVSTEKSMIKQMLDRNTQAEDLIQKVKKIKKQLFKKYLNGIMKRIQIQELKIVYIPQEFHEKPKNYITWLLNTLHDLQFVKKQYRKAKFRSFLNTYKSYYDIDLPLQQQNPDAFLIKKYNYKKSQVYPWEEHVLINLYDLVKCRKKERRDYGFCFQLIQQIYKELKRHHTKTKKPYPLLDPKDIIFNQSSLTISLSYQKPLRQAIGFLKMPLNIEQSICFHNTPRLIDKFASPFEVSFSKNEIPSSDELHYNCANQQIFYDILYGIDSIMNGQNKGKIMFADQKTMADVKSEYFCKSLAWRFLFIASFIMHGQQFDKLSGVQFLSLKHFASFLEQLQQKIQIQNTTYIFENILGPQFRKRLKYISFQPKYSFIQGQGLGFFQQLFEPDKNEYKYIQLKSFIKTNNYMTKISKIASQFFQLLQQKNGLYMSVYPTVKYLIRFYIGLYIELRNIKLLSQYFQIDVEKGAKLLDDISDLNKKKNLLLSLKSISYIDKCMNKFGQYEQRYQTNQEEPIKFLRQTCAKYYKNVSSYHKLYKKIRELVLNLLAIKKQANDEKNDSREQRNIDKKNISQTVLAMSQFFTKNKQTISTIRLQIQQIIEKFIIYHIEANKQMKQQQRNNQIYKLRIVIKLILFMSRDNFITMESLISPIVDKQFKKDGSLKDKSQIYQYALQILEGIESEQLRKDGIGPQKV